MTSPAMTADQAAQTKSMIDAAHMTWEFTADGKIMVTVMDQSQNGTYVRTGNVVETTDTKTQEKERMELTSLTDEEMVFTSEEDGAVVTWTMKRVK